MPFNQPQLSPTGEEEQSFATYTTTWPPSCEHKNGWWETIRVWWFERRYFVCTDCERLIEITSSQLLAVENAKAERRGFIRALEKVEAIAAEFDQDPGDALSIIEQYVGETLHNMSQK